MFKERKKKILKERNIKCWKREIKNIKREKYKMCKGGNVKREKYEILKERNIKCLKGEMGNVNREKSSCKSAATGDTIATFSDTLSPVSVAATSWEFPEIYHPFLNSQHISFFLSFF